MGIALIVAAAGMYGYSQWQYHEQDVENEKLAAYATVDDQGTSAPVVDWAGLKAVNPEVVGWVQIPNTVVSFPVYQASDNDKYLHTNAEGNYSLGGQVFMDYQEPGARHGDQQTIIYGHHLQRCHVQKTYCRHGQAGGLRLEHGVVHRRMPRTSWSLSSSTTRTRMTPTCASLTSPATTKFPRTSHNLLAKAVTSRSDLGLTQAR